MIYVAMDEEGTDHTIEVCGKGCHPECHVVVVDGEPQEVKILGHHDEKVKKRVAYQMALMRGCGLILEFREQDEPSRVDLLAELSELKGEKVGA